MKKNVIKLPPGKLEELEQLRANVAHAEAHGQTDSVHHVMLKRLEVELGLITSKKESREQDEVNDGQQNL